MDELKETRYWRQVVKLLVWYSNNSLAVEPSSVKKRKLWVRASNTCARHKDAHSAEMLMQSMQESGVEPDKVINSNFVNRRLIVRRCQTM